MFPKEGSNTLGLIIRYSKTDMELCFDCRLLDMEPQSLIKGFGRNPNNT